MVHYKEEWPRRGDVPPAGHLQPDQAEGHHPGRQPEEAIPDLGRALRAGSPWAGSFRPTGAGDSRPGCFALSRSHGFIHAFPPRDDPGLEFHHPAPSGPRPGIADQPPHERLPTPGRVIEKTELHETVAGKRELQRRGRGLHGTDIEMPPAPGTGASAVHADFFAVHRDRPRHRGAHRLGEPPQDAAIPHGILADPPSDQGPGRIRDGAVRARSPCHGTAEPIHLPVQAIRTDAALYVILPGGHSQRSAPALNPHSAGSARGRVSVPPHRVVAAARAAVAEVGQRHGMPPGRPRMHRPAHARGSGSTARAFPEDPGAAASTPSTRLRG